MTNQIGKNAKAIVTLPKSNPCPFCKGNRLVATRKGAVPCPKCNGTGQQGLRTK